MSEDQPLENANHVTFSWANNPEDPNSRELCIVAAYENARLHLDFTDDGGSGTRAMHRVIATMPVILQSIRQELMIRHETDGLDKDLFDLLGGDDA